MIDTYILCKPVEPFRQKLQFDIDIQGSDILKTTDFSAEFTQL